jgi:hypothetical protein
MFGIIGSVDSASAALPIFVLAITVGGAREAVKIWSGRSKHVPSAIELVGMPSSMEKASTVAKISRRLAVRKEDCRRGVGRGQQRCIDDSRPHR